MFYFKNKFSQLAELSLYSIEITENQSIDISTNNTIILDQGVYPTYWEYNLENSFIEFNNITDTIIIRGDNSLQTNFENYWNNDRANNSIIFQGTQHNNILFTINNFTFTQSQQSQQSHQTILTLDTNDISSNELISKANDSVYLIASNQQFSSSLLDKTNTIDPSFNIYCILQNYVIDDPNHLFNHNDITNLVSIDNTDANIQIRIGRDVSGQILTTNHTIDLSKNNILSYSSPQNSFDQGIIELIRPLETDRHLSDQCVSVSLDNSYNLIYFQETSGNKILTSDYIPIPLHTFEANSLVSNVGVGLNINMTISTVGLSQLDLSGGELVQIRDASGVSEIYTVHDHVSNNSFDNSTENGKLNLSYSLCS